MHDFIVKRAVNFVPDLLLHSLRAPAKNARHFYSCFQACILPPNFLTGSLSSGKLHRWLAPCEDDDVDLLVVAQLAAHGPSGQRST